MTGKKETIIKRKPQSSSFTNEQWEIIEKGNLEKEKPKENYSMIEKRRKDQKQKTFYMDKELEKALIKYLASKKMNGEKVSFQSLVENHLRRELKDYF